MSVLLKSTVLFAFVVACWAENCQHRPKVALRKCCTIPRLIDESVHRTCLASKLAGAVTHPHPKFTVFQDSCLVLCEFNAAGIAQNGTVNRNALLAKFTTIAAGNADLLSAATKAIDKCLDGNGRATSSAPGAVTPACDSNAAAVNTCVHREILLNCPASYKTMSDECSAYVAFVASCPPPMIF